MAVIPIFQHERNLPPILGGLRYQSTSVYCHAPLDVGVWYAVPNGYTADVFLYDPGRENAPAGVTDPRLQGFSQSAVSAVFASERNGTCRDVRILGTWYARIPEDAPEPTYLWTALSYVTEADPTFGYTGLWYSHLAIRADCGFVNKVRYSYIEPRAADGVRNLGAFLQDWYIAVQGARLLVGGRDRDG
jgi:hypothetical protein